MGVVAGLVGGGQGANLEGQLALQVHALTGPLRVVIIELQLMLLWSHMKYHFGIICNFLQSFSVSSLSS